MMRDLRYRWRALRRRREFEDELDEELRYHFERLVERHGADGLDEPEARRRARLEFGLESLKEECRESRGTAWVEDLWSDLRLAVRQLRKTPVFSAVAVVSLALGIGANTAIFSLLDSVVFRPLPVRDPGELVLLRAAQGSQQTGFSYPLFRELKERQSALEGMLASAEAPFEQLTARVEGGAPAPVRIRLVSGDYFQVLGVPMRSGRALAAADDALEAAGVAVISDRYWKERFQRSPEALGKSITVNRAQLRVVGVAPPEFLGEIPGSVPDLWAPLSQQPLLMPQELLTARFVTWLNVMGRLRPGVSREQVQLEWTALLTDLRHFTIQTSEGAPRIEAVDGSKGFERLRESYSRPLWVLMAMVASLLLIACLNLAGLLLARGAARARELSLRLALGAGRARLVRQMLTEYAVLTASGSAAAILVAVWMVNGLAALSGETGAGGVTAALNLRVLGFTALCGLAAPLLSGLIPALTATRLDWQGSKQGIASPPRGAEKRMRAALAIQAAISFVLVSQGLALGWSLYKLRTQSFGLAPEELLMVQLPLELTKSARERQTLVRTALLERVRTIPGVEAASVSSCGPMEELVHTVRASSARRSYREGTALRMVHVSEDYFKTLRLDLVAGRGIGAQDGSGSQRVTVLSRAAARLFFGEEEAVGQSISLGETFDASTALLVVGVVADLRFANPREPHGPVLLVPLEQQAAPATSLCIRTGRNAADLAPLIQQAVRESVPGLPLGRVATYRTLIESSLRKERLLAVLAAVFSGVTLLLALIGVSGVAQYGASRRRQEYGIRIALGAERREIAAAVLRSAAVPLAVGWALGMAGLAGGARGMQELLFEVTPLHPAVLGAAALAMTVFGLVAALYPAMEAARRNPLDSLRAE